jgi:hypothetical protein
MMSKRDEYTAKLNDLLEIVKNVEKAFESGDDLDAAILEGARATRDLRDLRDAASKSRMTDIRDKATELKTRLRVAMLEGTNG